MKVIEPLPHHVFDFVDLVKEFLDEGIDAYDWGVNEDDLHTSEDQIVMLPLPPGFRVFGINRRRAQAEGF